VGVPTPAKIPKGFIIPKIAKIRPGIKISSFNKTMNNFLTFQAIFAKICSIGVAWRKKFKIFSEITEISFQGSVLWKNAPNADFKPKHLVD
jgi:hypothetical protein